MHVDAVRRLAPCLLFAPRKRSPFCESPGQKFKRNPTMQFRDEIKALDSRSRVGTFVQKRCEASPKGDESTEKLNNYLYRIAIFLTLAKVRILHEALSIK